MAVFARRRQGKPFRLGIFALTDLERRLPSERAYLVGEGAAQSLIGSVFCWVIELRCFQQK